MIFIPTWIVLFFLVERFRFWLSPWEKTAKKDDIKLATWFCFKYSNGDGLGSLFTSVFISIVFSIFIAAAF